MVSGVSRYSVNTLRSGEQSIDSRAGWVCSAVDCSRGLKDSTFSTEVRLTTPRRPRISFHLFSGTYPQSSFSSQHAEEQFEFFDGDAVTGQNSQHVHQKVCSSGSRGINKHTKTIDIRSGLLKWTYGNLGEDVQHTAWREHTLP